MNETCPACGVPQIDGFTPATSYSCGSSAGLDGFRWACRVLRYKKPAKESMP